MLKPVSARGFTLIEVMLSLVILSVVSGTLYQLLLSSQRLSRAQAERVTLQSTARGAALVIGNELRELSTVSGLSSTGNDLLSLGPHAVSYRAMRGFGFTCQSLSAGVLRIARAVFTGHRDPQPGRDSVLLYAPGVLNPADSDWTAAAITGVSSAGSCAEWAGPAITLTTTGAAAVPAGTPVRVYEPMQLALYQSEGRYWLGMRSISSGESIQPMFGPLAGTDGFRLEFADAAGSTTTVPPQVRSITVTLRASGDSGSQPSGWPVVEELITQIVLKNGSS